MTPGTRRLTIGDWAIPEEALAWSFSPSGGPGGQHANRSNTRATLRLDLDKAGLATEVLDDVRAGLGTGVRGAIVEVQVDESRSQWRNRQKALERMQELLEDSLRPSAPRVPTRPTKASSRRWRRQKERRGQTKRLRRPPPAD